MTGRSVSPALRYLLGGLAALMLVVLVLILLGNDGNLVYSLDDAYIHFALAENLIHGHYGVNSSEMSAPASSILWPLLVAPLTLFVVTDWLVLAVNAVFALLTLKVVWGLLDPLVGVAQGRSRPLLYGLLFFLLIVIGNLVGLVFTGMEHSLQVLLACLIVAGLWQQVETGLAPRYLFAALILIPLLRYESMAITGSALLYLFYVGQRRAALLSGLLIAAVMLAFSAFLYSQDLGILPTSIMAKSGHYQGADAGVLSRLAGRALGNIKTPVGLILLACILSLLPALLNRLLAPRKRLFAAVLFCAGWLHLLVGSLWWYGRYETYLLISLVLGALLLYQDGLRRIWNEAAVWPVLWRLYLPLLLVGLPSIFVLLTTSSMSGIIYRQPYQFQRLVADYYREPVGLNDLGLVSFRNPNYVLDLWGLANQQALKLRASRDDPAWMDELARQYDVGLVFVTDAWFEQMPENWIRVASFNRNDLLAAATQGYLGEVGFYATAPRYVDDIRRALTEFRETLPAPSTLDFVDPKPVLTD